MSRVLTARLAARGRLSHGAHLVADVAHRLDQRAASRPAWRAPGGRGCRPCGCRRRSDSPTPARAAASRVNTRPRCWAEEAQQLELLVGQRRCGGREPAPRSRRCRSRSSSILRTSSEPNVAVFQSSWRIRAYSSAGTIGISTKSSNPIEKSSAGRRGTVTREQDRRPRRGRRRPRSRLMVALGAHDVVARLDHHHVRRVRSSASSSRARRGRTARASRGTRGRPARSRPSPGSA